MRGTAVPRDRSQLRTCSGREALRGCKVKGNLDNVVVIDVECDKFPNIIIIDVPEYLENKLDGSGGSREAKKFQFEGVISIDDDEEDSNVDPPGTGVEGRPDLDSDATSGKRSCDASKSVHNSGDAVGDESRVRREKSALNSSKRKQSYASKVPSRNRFGLNSESESGSSDSDHSDCEVIENFGLFREQWEKASLKRKNGAHKARSGMVDHASSSGCYSDGHLNLGGENRTKQHKKNPVFSSSTNGKFEKDTFSGTTNNLGGIASNSRMGSPFVESHKNVDHESFRCEPTEKKQATFFETSNSNLGGTASDSRMGSPFVESNQNVYHEILRSQRTEKTQSSPRKTDARFRTERSAEDPPVYAEWRSNKYANGSRTSFVDEEESPQGPSSRSNEEQGEKQDNHTKTYFHDKQQNIMGEHCFSSSQPRANMHFKYWKAGDQDEEASLKRSQHSGETRVKYDSSQELKHKGAGFSQEYFSSSTVSNEAQYNRTSFKEKGNGESVVSDHPEPDEKQADFGEVPFKDKVRAVPKESFFSNTSMCGISELSNEEAGFQEKDKQDSQEVPLSNTQCDETQIKSKERFVDSLSDSQSRDEKDAGHAQNDVMTSVHKDIINEREKLKETEEYKRAIEEEWAARQQQLQIQAEEAQRLRKRRRAETLRLLDMERRQKQRVEEVRETQKKDEEYMNLKEQLRVEIRQELNRLELTCINMPSLLRGLGIHVGGGPQPMSNEVHAAYKRALLRFHPDRASRMDIRQQVEAEEKFKLISRMKEKFLS